MSPMRSTRVKRQKHRQSRRIRTVKGGADPSDKAMVIVEPREHRNLKRVLENFHEVMDKSWDLYVFHGKSKGKFAGTATKDLHGRKVHLIPLDTDNMTYDEYNKLFLDPAFWKQVKAENILVFQTDAALCKKFGKKIDKFTKYDYIGCSYDNSRIGNGPWPNHKFYGVGGLSFRKRSFMLKCISSSNSANAENVTFSDCVHKLPTKPESAEILAEFCTQNEFNKHSFGAHKTNFSLRSQNKNSFKTYCPEANGLDENP